MLKIVTTPRTMSAWLANFLTIPGQSLYVHDPAIQPGILEALESYEIPHKGYVMSMGPTAQEWEPQDPDIVIVDDAETIARRLRRLFHNAMDSEVEQILERMADLPGEHYHVADVRDWIGPVFERGTGLDFDPVYYAALLNMHVESRFAAGAKAGQVDLDGLGPLLNVLQKAPDTEDSS